MYIVNVVYYELWMYIVNVELWMSMLDMGVMIRLNQHDLVEIQRAQCEFNAIALNFNEHSVNSTRTV